MYGTFEIYAGLGSNIDPERHLGKAIEALRHRYGRIDLSPVYRNPAVGFVGDDFLNLVIRFRSEHPPAELERSFPEMERAAGRRKPATAGAPEFGPRTLDLDLLLYGARVDPAARLPRNDILRHAFVLRPLADLAPDLVHPLTGRTMADHWRAVEARSPSMQRVRTVSRPPYQPTLRPPSTARI